MQCTTFDDPPSATEDWFKMTISLDLGSGPTPRNIFNADEAIGIDTFNQDEPKVIKWDLECGKLPFDSDSLDYILAFDCLEHVSRIGFRPTIFQTLEKYNPFIDLMSEIWRTLRSNGDFYAMTPVLPHTNEVFRDPTHVNVFTPDMINYFVSNVGDHSMLGLTQHYGFTGEFHKIAQRFEGAHVIWHLRAIK